MGHCAGDHSPAGPGQAGSGQHGAPVVRGQHRAFYSQVQEGADQEHVRRHNQGGQRNL